MKLAKPLKLGGSPLIIVTGSFLRSGRMAEQLRRSLGREALRAARNFAGSPKHDKPRKKVVDMEGERVTCREASNSVCATGECVLFPSGSVAVARMQRNGINLGDLPRTRKGLPDQLTEGSLSGVTNPTQVISRRQARQATPLWHTFAGRQDSADISTWIAGSNLRS
jgi:hypothetical protein